MKLFYLKLPLFLFLATGSLFAQDTQIRSRELQQQVLPGLGEGAAEYEEDGEFGKILTLKRAKPWYIIPYASARGYWTSNVLLTNIDEESDEIFVDTQGLTAGYRITKDWRVQAGYSYQLTRYHDKVFLDTNAHNVEFGSTYGLPWDFQLGGGVRGLWLNEAHQLELEIYKETNPYGSLMRSQSFLDDRLNWFYGYQFDQKYASPRNFDRIEHTLFTGISYAWMPNLLSQLVFRQNWQFYDFRAPSAFPKAREEWISSVALQTVWQPFPWLQVSAFGLATYDNSVNAARDYDAANLGGEVRFFWKF